MTEDQLKDLVLRKLGQIAPEADLENLDPHKAFRDQFDFDSVDCLNLSLALGEELNITIPESDYPKLTSLDGCVRYLQSKITA
jgi:acyl carrier protein